MAKRVKKSGGTADAGRGAEIVMTRLPHGMKAKVAALADSNGRSMNSEIIAAIEQHLTGPTRLDAIEAFMEKHRKMLEEMSDYDWFGTEGVLADIERLRRQVSEIDERTEPPRYDD